MTQPTGEHASGVKLASAYVEVTGKTDALKQDTTRNLDAIADHGKVVGQQTADNIVTAVGAAGPKASTAFGESLAGAAAPVTAAAAKHADSYAQTFKDAIHNTRMSEDIEYLLGKNDDLIRSYGGVHGESYMQRFLQVMAGHAQDARDAGSKTGEAIGAGAIDSLDRGGLKDYINRMQSWKIDAQRSVLDIGQTYAQMSSAGTYSLDQLKAKHEELAAAQQKVKEGSLNIADAQQRLHSMGRDVAEAGGGLLNAEAFNKASEGVERLGSKFGEAGEAAGGLGGQLAGMGGMLKMFASPEVLGIGGILAVVGGLGEVVAKVNELGESWEDLGHKLEIATGATGERLEGMKADIKGVYGGVTTSMDQTASIFAAVQKGMKDTGQGAKDVTTQLAHLQSMGQSVDVTTLGTAFKGFNIAGDAAQQESVIDQLLHTAQDTQMPINDFNSALQRLAPTMDTLHISMKDSLAILDEFGQAGIKPEQTFMIMNRAAQDATKHHKDFKVALQEDIDAIKNAPTEEAAQEKAKEIFGASAGRGGAAQAVQAIRSGQFSLDPATLASLENYDGLVNKTWKDTLTWHDSWTLFTHQMADALQPVSERLHGEVNQGMQNLIGFFTQHQAGITQFTNSIVDGFEKGAGAIGSFVTKNLPAWKEGLHEVTAYLAPAFDNLKPHLEALGKALGPFIESIGHAAVPIVKALGEALIWALNETMKLMPPVIDFTTDLVKVLTDVFNWIGKNFGPDMSKQINDTKEDIKHVKDAYEDIVTAVKKVVETVHNWYDDGKKIYDDIVTDVKKVVQVWDDVYNKIKSVVDAINNIHIPDLHLPSIPGVHGQTGLALGGYGGGDIVPAMLEPGEHVFTKEEVKAAGGHDNIYALRYIIQSGMLPELLGFQGGGDVPDPHHSFYKDWYGTGAGATPLPGVGTVPPTVGLNAQGELVPLQQPTLVSTVKPVGPHKPGETAAKGADTASAAHTGVDVAGKGVRGAQLIPKLGDAEWLGTLAKWAAHPAVEGLGKAVLPWDLFGAANWAMNVSMGTHYSPLERLQYGWDIFSATPKHHAAADRWNTYKGSTPQSLHIPGTNTNLLDIFKSVTGYGGHSIFGGLFHASGGAVHPAGRERHEHGWVIDRFKQAGIKVPHFQDGGAVGQWGGLTDVKALLAAESGRTPYVFGGYSPKGVDCSGLVAEAVEIYLGLPMSGGHPMSTGNEGAWLAAHGFTAGMGPEGTFRVGFYNGGPGGGHTALTLPDGTNAESGGSGGGVRLGGGAAGANSSEFTEHYWLPAREVVSPAGYSGTPSGYGGTGGGSGASGFGGGGSASTGGADSAAAFGGGSAGLWDAVAKAESSGNWANQDTGGTGHYGGLQFSLDTWRAYGGQGNPADATREEQIEIANRVAFTGWQGKQPQGLKAWQAITQGKVPGVTTSTPASAFGGTGGGDGNYGGTTPPTPEQTAKYNDELAASSDRIAAATNRVHEAQAKLNKDREDGKDPDVLAKDQDHLTEAQNRLTEATTKYQELLAKPPEGKAAKDSRGEGGGKGEGGKDSDSILGDLFGIGYKGVQEQLPEGFSNPLEWGVTKSLSAGLKFFGALLGGDGKEAYNSLVGSGGRGGGAGSGQVSPYVQSLMAQVPGYTAGGGGGGDNVYNHTVNYNGNVTGPTNPDPSAAAVRGLLRTLGAATQ